MNVLSWLHTDLKRILGFTSWQAKRAPYPAPFQTQRLGSLHDELLRTLAFERSLPDAPREGKGLPEPEDRNDVADYEKEHPEQHFPSLSESKRF
jgi:hypothetical protein